MSSVTRIRAPHKIHVLSWALALERDGSVACHFKDCQFMALSLEEMGSHYPFCACENNKYPFVCETCNRRTDAIEKLLLHKSYSHSYSLTDEESRKINDYLATPVKKEITSVLRRSWEIFLEKKKYLKCLMRKCLFVTDSMADMEEHYLSSCEETFWSQLKYECEFCHGRLLNDHDLKLHIAQAHHSKTYLIKNNVKPDSHLNRIQMWSEEIMLYKQGKCFVDGCQFVDNYVKILEKHYTNCDGTKKNFIICCACGSWLLNETRLNEHKRCFHKDLDEEDFKKLAHQYELESESHSSLMLDDMSSDENDPLSREAEVESDRRANDLKKYNGVKNRASGRSSAVRLSPPVFPAKNTDSIDCTQVSDRSGIQYDSDILEINEGSLDIIDIDTSVTKEVLSDGMKLNDKKKRKRNNPKYFIEKQFMKDSEKKNFSVFQKRNHENWPTPLQVFANEMMKENKNNSTVPVQIKVDNKDWTVNVSTTVVSQSKSSSEFPRSREALFKSLKEESYKLLKLVSKKNSIRNDVRMVFDPNENRITPFHINFKRDNGSSDKCRDDLDMTKFLSSDVEDSDDLSNSDISECDGHDSIDSPVSPPNAEFSGFKVTDEAHNLIDEESNKQDTISKNKNEVDSSLLQCDTNVQERDDQMLCSNEPNSSGTVAESELNPIIAFKDEVNHDVTNKKSHDSQQANDFLEKEVNQNSSNDRTNILCLSDINHLGEEVMVKNELDHQVLPEKVIAEDKDSVVHIEVFSIAEDQQGIIARSEESAETNNLFESEYIIPEIDFVDNSGFRCSNEPTNDVSDSFHADCSSSSYDFESDAGVNFAENGVSSVHSNDNSQDVSEEAINKTNEELVLLDGGLPTATLQGTDEKDPLSIDGFTGGALFSDPETDYENRDIYSSDKNDSCSNENNIHLPGNNEKGICDNTLESTGENTDDFNLSNKWNWSNLKKYNSKTVHNDITKVPNRHSKEHVNKQLKEDDIFLGFSDCTDSSSKYSDFVSACNKLGYYDDMVILNQHYEIIPPRKKNTKFLHSELSEHGLSKKRSTTVNGDDNNAIILQKETTEKKTHTTQEVKSEVINIHESGNDSEDAFLGFKSNKNYAKFRRKSIEISRRLSEEVLDGKVKINPKLSCNGENISPFQVAENNTSNESSIRRGNLVKCKVSSNAIKLIDPSIESIEGDTSLTLNKNTNLSNLSIDSKKAVSTDNNRRTSIESVPKKRGRPKKNQNQSTTVNTFNDTINRNENTNAALKLNVSEKDDESMANKLAYQSAKESSPPSLIIGTEDKNGSSVVLLNSPSSRLTNVMQGINGSHTNPNVSCDEAKETGNYSADDVSLTQNGNDLTCKLDRGLSQELDLNNSRESLSNTRSSPEKNPSQSVISSSADKVKSSFEKVIVSSVEENSDAEVKEFKKFKNGGSSAVIDPPKSAEQESTPILGKNTVQEMKNLGYRDEVEETSHHSVDNVSVIPLENKENILSGPVKPVFRKEEDRPEENNFKSIASQLTVQCYGTLELKEENTKDEESNHYGNDNEPFVDELPNWTTKEQSLPISITNNDDISVSSKSLVSKVVTFSQCMNNTQGDNSLRDELKEISSSAPDASSFETKGHTLIRSNMSRKSPIHLIASTPTKSNFTSYMNGENANPSVEESDPFCNEESIINFSADEHNMTSSNFIPEKDGAPIESDNDEKPSSDLKPVEDRSEKNMETTKVNAAPFKRKPGRPPKRLLQCFQESNHLQRRSSNSFDSSLAISEFGNKSSLLNSSDSLEPGTHSCAEQKEVDDKIRNILQVEKKDILDTSLKRKPGRPPKRLSQCFKESEQLQGKSCNIFDSSSAISESGNSHLFNPSASLKPGTNSCAENKEVDDKTRNISLFEKEDNLETPLKRKRGRPPKNSLLCYQESKPLQKPSSNILDSSKSESEKKIHLFNSSNNMKNGTQSCAEQNEVDDNIRNVLLVEKKDILETPLKRKRGRPPKHSLLSCHGSNHLQRKSSNITDSPSESGNKSLLLNSSASLECGQLTFSGQNNVDDKSTYVLLVENEVISETLLKKKPGRPPKLLSLGRDETGHKEINNIPVVKSDNPIDSHLISNSLSKEETRIKTETNLMESEDLQIRNPKSDIELSSITDHNKLENVNVDIPDNKETKTCSEPVLKRKPGRPPKHLSVSVNDQGFKSDNQDNNKIYNVSQLSSNISEFNKLVSSPSTSLESFPMLRHGANEKANFKPEESGPDKNISLKRKPGRPRKHSLLQLTEIKQCNIEGKASYNNDSGLDTKVSLDNSLSSMFSHETKENVHCKPNDNLLMEKKDCLEPPLKRKRGRPPKCLTMCQQKNQSSINNKNSNVSKNNINQDQHIIKQVLSQEDAFEELADSEKNSLEQIIEREPDKLTSSLSMSEQEIEECKLENKNIFINEDDFCNVSESEDAEHQLEVDVKSIEPSLKRKPGRPPKRSTIGLQIIEKLKLGVINYENISSEDSDKSVINNTTVNSSSNVDSLSNNIHSNDGAIQSRDEKNCPQAPPKRKPGRPPKRSSIGLHEIEKCQIKSLNTKDIPFDERRSLNKSLLNSYSNENVTHSEEIDKNKIVKREVSFEAPLKRKPGRPPKHLSVSQPDINLFKNKNNTNQNVLLANSSMTDCLEPEPKRKPGRPRKLNLELISCDESNRNNAVHNRDHMDVKVENERSLMDDNSFDVTDGTSSEISQSVPIRKSRRPRKVSLVLGKSSDASYKLVFERDDIFSALNPSHESFVNLENTPKRRPGRPKKLHLESQGRVIPEKERSLGNMATSTPLSNQTTSSLSFNSFADLEVLDGCNTFDKEVPKKRRGRIPQREKFKHHRLRERFYSITNYTTFNNHDSELEASKNISTQERVPNIESSLSLTFNSEDGCDNTVSNESQETECLDESELTYKQIARIKKRKILSGRVDYTTRLKNPNDKVKCALCGEMMTVIYYQKKHLLKHNFMCWLEGEEPLPLDDVDKMETLLIRGKRAIPKFVFKCEVCHLEKKSAKGLLSHKQFCGKSEKERENMMESCRYCGRLMMPASLQPHLYQSHRSEIFQLPDSPPEEPPGPVRKAAAKCLGKIASLIEENSLTKKVGDFHVDGDEEFDEIEEISLLYIPVQKKKTTKHLTNRWKQLAADNKELSCVVPACTFTAMTVKEIVQHHRSCNADGSQGFSCIKCNYICKVEDEMREHVKSCNPPIMVSQSDNSEDEDHEKHVIIPYLRTAEHSTQLGRFKSLFFKPALVWMKEIYKKYFTQEPLYPDLHLNIDLWEEMDLQTSQFYNPEKSNSMMISFQNSSWESMHALEGKVIEGNQGIAYTGGPVWGLEWCPGEGPQYLAISSHLSMEFNFQAGSTFTGPGLVQLWSLEDISNAKSDPLSTLQFCYGVCHNERACWNMAWCPSGGRTETRIGLLALATTSGSIPIYAMPNPECLQYQSTRFYKPEPVLKLELWSNERWQCSAISWSKIKPHNIIAAGFVNGVIAVWNLETQSKLLRKNTILYPFKVFQAHHSIITGVCLSPESDNYLATASYDKSFKYWDLIDTTAPHTVLKRGLFTSVDWLRHWMSAVTTYDNAYTMMQTTVSLSSVRGFVNPTTPVITSINSTAWSVSANDWLNGAITSYDNGQVLLFLALRQTNYLHIDKRKFSKVILNSALHNIEAKNGSTEPNSKQNEKETHNNNMPSNSYGDAIRKYGLSIKTDPNIGRYDKFQEKGSENMNDIYPLSSINRVAWNPNRNSFLYTAMGFQSGFLVVSKLSFNHKDFNRIEELSKV